MTQEITNVRKHFYTCEPECNQWIVDIVGEPNARIGYIQPDGTGGPVYGYDSKEEAEVVAALYIAKNVHGDLEIETSAGVEKKRTCRDCGFFSLSLPSNCAQDYGILGADSPCNRFWSKVPAGEKKEPKTFVNGAKGKIRKFDTGATRDTVEGKLDYVKALCPLVLRRYVQYLDKHRLQPDGSMRDFDNWKNGMPRETYHSSKGRHFFADWLLEEGYEVSDNHGPVDEEDALCGELFNTMGKLREILRAKLQAKKE